MSPQNLQSPQVRFREPPGTDREPGTAPERRQVEGLEGIAHALRLPPGIDTRRIVRWIRKRGLPATLIAGRYFADRAELEAWWGRFRVSAMAGNGRR